MNEFNHTNIIKELPKASLRKSKIKEGLITLPDALISVFKTASDFTDSVYSLPNKDLPSNYFFFHFYYNVTASGSQISLTRVDENSRSSVSDMQKCDYSYWKFDSKTKEKKFFAAINGRKKPGLLDLGNQGDEVSFLHAMAEEEITRDPLADFKDHLGKCFKEYLFLTDSNRADFMLGIAFHGIMDSFTPSHMGFQQYALQDMGLHAQGDVIPIIGQKTYSAPIVFDPGQYLKESSGKQKIYMGIKHYGICYIRETLPLNPTEFKMLKIFIIIGDLVFKDSFSDKGAYIGRLNFELLGNFMKMKFWGKNIKQVNAELSRKYTAPDGTQHYCYSYGPRSYVFSACAIEAIVDIYSELSALKKKVTTYEQYKKEVTQENIDRIINIWQDYYSGNIRPSSGLWNEWLNNESFMGDVFFDTEELNISSIRRQHLALNLYAK